MRSDYTISAESVTEGHPDKICDQISDAVLDDLLRQDSNSRVACESAIKDSGVWVLGEVTTEKYCDVPTIARSVMKSIGYDSPELGLDYNSCSIHTSLERQSPEISQGVSKSIEEQGAGDQGMMFGYACRDTAELMPMPIYFAHRLTEKLAETRKTGKLLFLRPDGKSQVTVRYENNKPVAVQNVTIAAQHDEDVSAEDLKEGIIEEVVKKAISLKYLTNIDFNNSRQFIINGTGRFTIGGPKGDAGLTGRKIIVDTYGGFARHGGGAFSGKDPSKVDRSAAYMARYIAKNLVASGLANRCEVQLAYTIGVAEPNNLMIDTFGTGKINDSELEKIVKYKFPLKPGLIIEHLKLKNPIFLPTASYGHFGRKPYSENGLDFFTWEKADKAEELRELARTL
ncbi:S-adenosylmethionine synthase [uncultured archaeon]|nr:S-adenosylmethionine synthase [uncultured archaeon]